VSVPPATSGGIVVIQVFQTAPLRHDSSSGFGARADCPETALNEANGDLRGFAAVSGVKASPETLFEPVYGCAGK
jgi:hypothetical protein